jgi:hypothetical protein
MGGKAALKWIGCCCRRRVGMRKRKRGEILFLYLPKYRLGCTMYSIYLGKYVYKSENTDPDLLEDLTVPGH